MWYKYFIDFQHVVSVLLIFSYGIEVLGTPQTSPSLYIDTHRQWLESQQTNH